MSTLHFGTYSTALNDLSTVIHQRNVEAGWYTNLATNELMPMSGPGSRNVPEMIALIHSEVSEGLEGYRKNLMDDKLPHRPMLEVELADTLIRIFDLAGYQGLDLGGAVMEKLEYNATREDHKLANRKADNGKKI